MEARTSSRRLRTDKRFDSMWESENGRSNLRMLLLSRLHEPVTYGAIVIDHALKAGFWEAASTASTRRLYQGSWAATTRTSFLKLRSATTSCFPDKPLKGRFEKSAERRFSRRLFGHLLRGERV